MAVKEAAVQRKHNLYRDSMILSNSDPNLHLLGETSPVDWATKFGGDEVEGSVSGGVAGGGAGKKRRQVVSMIQLDGVPLPYESCLEVPGVELIPEEDAEVSEGRKEGRKDDEEDLEPSASPKSPDSVNEIRDLINPVVEVVVPVSKESQSDMANGVKLMTGTITMEDGLKEQVTHVTTVVEDVPNKSPQDKISPQTILQQLVGSKKQEADKRHQEEAAIKNAIEEIEIAVQEEDSEKIAEVANSHLESSPLPLPTTDSSMHLNGEDKIMDPVDVEVIVA
ncbi:hypothetical protein Q5P01_024461 [Channa striata]|uniref:Uncharacterized protein n=1 Tax=Channa striata TaxID=64152 RepID=A0AA88J481_CHASR|nr:hypothetical protein Q5P01_024461 [Channa striata]